MECDAVQLVDLYQCFRGTDAYLEDGGNRFL